MIKRSKEHLAREKALYLYGSALAEGDFDTVSAVLKLAECDGQLAQLLYELDQADEAAEERPAIPEQDVVLVQNLLRKYLPDNPSTEQIPEVTVGEVVARQVSYAAARKQNSQLNRAAKKTNLGGA